MFSVNIILWGGENIQIAMIENGTQFCFFVQSAGCVYMVDVCADHGRRKPKQRWKFFDLIMNFSHRGCIFQNTRYNVSTRTA